MKPRIMVVNNTIEMLGGAERLISELCNYLTHHYYPVTIFTPSAVPEFKRILKDVRIVETGTKENLIKYVNDFSHKFDIVNPHNHPTETYFAYPFKAVKVWQCNEPPVSVLKEQGLNQHEGSYVKRTTKRAVVLTEYDRIRFNRVYNFDATVNPVGINYDFFNEDVKIRDTLNMKDNFVLTQVGYFTWTKNQVRTVEIFSEVKKEIPNAKLVLVGYSANTPTSYRQEVYSKVEELGLEGDIVFIDFQKEAALRNIYKQTNVFLSPILDQGGILSVFEAISAGVPTIVSDSFVASDIVKDNDLGKVAQIKDFPRAILGIYSDMENEREKTIEKARWIKENLTWERFGEKYEEIFEEALQ